MNDELAREIVNGATITIYHDDDPPNPRDDTNAGVIVIKHRDDLGDREPTDDERKAIQHGGFEALAKHLLRTEGGTNLTPIGLLDHSGLHLYIGGGAHYSDQQGWDSGTAGFTYTTPTHLADVGIVSGIDKALAQDIIAYDKYLRGEAYGYVVEVNGEHVDSCWGFDDYEYCLSEARDAAIGAREQIQAEWVSEFI